VRSKPRDLTGTLALFEAIGSDRHLDFAEICDTEAPLANRMWEVYVAEFGCLVGATGDSAFRRFDHPARQTGRVVWPAGSAVLVVGTGPSLFTRQDELRRVRDRFSLVTSLRGASALEALGLVPDLVLMCEASPLDATLTLQTARAAGLPAVLGAAPGPLVAADERTPRELVDDLPPDRLFVPEHCPSWGWWPAAAVAMALQGGSRTVALLGVDAGSRDGEHGSFQPLVALLELLAALGTLEGVDFFDCGVDGAPKVGWLPRPLGDVHGSASPQVEVERAARPTVRERLADERQTLERIKDLVVNVRDLYQGTAGRGSRASEMLWDEMLEWGEDPWLRRAMQERLGLTFLPAFWRLARSETTSRSRARTQAIVLALDELFTQCDRLEAAVAAGLRSCRGVEV